MLETELIARYPVLFHMAEAGSWPTIRKLGLLSTTAALDRFEVHGPARQTLECAHRPEKVRLAHKSHGHLVLRDQKPMPVARLAGCLQADLSPADWYRILNGKTFFWATRERLITLLNARSYRNEEHDVLAVDTASLLGAHAARVSLCHLNSGNAFRIAQPRGRSTFMPIGDYRARGGRPYKEVAEVTVEYSVPDIVRHVIRVERMQQEELRQLIWQR
jgi:hypothetical protein